MTKNTEVLKLQVSGNTITVIQRPSRITSGTVGLQAEFAFDSQWDGLTKVALFRAGDTTRLVQNPEQVVVVPWEVLEKPNEWLRVGVYGVNADSSVVIPTVWADVCMIHTGVEPSADPSTDPTLSVWQQIGNAANTAYRLAADHMADTGNPHGITAEKIGAAEAGKVNVIERRFFPSSQQRTDLSIVGFARANVGTFSTSNNALRTDYISMNGVMKISGNAGFYGETAVIAFYNAKKEYLPTISLFGTAFLGTNVSYAEGAFELDVTGSAYDEAAYFVVSSYRKASGFAYTQTFGDDYCTFVKLGDLAPVYKIAQKSVAFFGDNITEAPDADGGYPSLIAAITGAKVTNYSRSSATLATGTSVTYKIAELVSNYQGGDDYICISGGINDYNKGVPLGTLTAGYEAEVDTTTVIGALESIFRNLLTKHTTAKLFYVITHKAASAENNDKGWGLTFTDYHDAIVSVLKKYSIPYYDAFADSGFITSARSGWGETMRALYTVNADGMHPNKEGYMKYYVYPIIHMLERG